MEVDANGNVRIKKLDFYTSDIENGKVDEIGPSWDITNISADGSHLGQYLLENRKAANTAPAFDTAATLTAEYDENSGTKISFPAASDDIRVISYFASVTDSSGAEVNKTELSSLYYRYADASELDGLTYTHTFTDLPVNQALTISVYAIDDFGAVSGTISTDITIESEADKAYPHFEFNTSKLNQNGWSGSVNAGTLTTDVSFNGRTAVAIGQLEENYEASSAIIMNNYSTPFTGVNTNPYLVIDYYYAHDENSDKSPASQMRWRFFIHALNYKQLNYTANLVTNQWATAVIPLADNLAYFAEDGYAIKQYKFDPFSETTSAALDNNDVLYISGIRLVHDDPVVFTQNGNAYASSDGYIEGVGSKISTTIADAVASLGEKGGTVYVEGDMIITEPTQIEASDSTRDAVTICGHGNTLEEQQANRIWFRNTNTGRDVKYGGDTQYDRITLKAPIDEAGMFSNGVKLTIGKDIAFEKTIKGSSDINAEGTKNMNFNLGASSHHSGSTLIDIYGGSYDDVSTFYMWKQSGTQKITTDSTYNFYGGKYTRVLAGARNSSTGELQIDGDVSYNFYGGTFTNVYTGHYSYGRVLGDTVYNIYGGAFPNGIYMSNCYAPDSKAYVGNSAVIVNSKGADGYTLSDKLVIKENTSNALLKTEDSKKFIAIINNAELEKAEFDTTLTADHKIRVYYGSAKPVFTDGTLSGYTITSDRDGLVPYVNGKKLPADENGKYILSDGAYDIRFAIDFATDYTESDNPETLSDKLVVVGAQFRADGNALRFIAYIGKDMLSAVSEYDSENIICESDKEIGYGFLAVPASLIDENADPIIGMEHAYTVPAVKKFDDSDPNYLAYTVCITGIAVKNYARDYVVRPYITYKDDNGDMITVYGEKYSTNLLEIAQTAVTADEFSDQAHAQKVIDDYNAYISE